MTSIDLILKLIQDLIPKHFLKLLTFYCSQWTKYQFTLKKKILPIANTKGGIILILSVINSYLTLGCLLNNNKDPYHVRIITENQCNCRPNWKFKRL